MFSLAAERLDRMEQVDLLTKELVRGLQTYQDRQQGFWERQATEAIGWRFLVRLAGVANLLVEFEGVDGQWKTAADAVAWYTGRVGSWTGPVNSCSRRSRASRPSYIVFAHGSVAGPASSG